MKQKGQYTLAIGDGANDVNMIQTATVGDGIIGNEGNQAATFADFAIPKFNGLYQLVFWHGRTFGTKIINHMSTTIYKNIMAILIMFITNCLNGFSANNVISDFYFIFFNILNTTFTVAAVLIFDQDVSIQFKQDTKVDSEDFSLPKKVSDKDYNPNDV